MCGERRNIKQKTRETSSSFSLASKISILSASLSRKNLQASRALLAASRQCCQNKKVKYTCIMDDMQFNRATKLYLFALLATLDVLYKMSSRSE
jgi:hypothetical protein